MKKKLRKILQQPLVIRMMSLGDQILFAGGNFLLTVLLTRYYTDVDLAAYGMAVSTGLILQGVQRNSYVIQNSVLDFKVLQSRGKKIIAEQIIAIYPLLCVVIAAALVAWQMLPDSIWSKTLAASCSCLVVFSQLEFERIILMKYKKFLIPFLTAATYVVLIGAMFLIHDSMGFYELMAIMLVFALLKASVLFTIVGAPDFKGGWILLRRDLRNNSIPSIMGVVGYSAYSHAPVLFLGVFCAPVQAAAFVAMRSLMHILQIIIRSMDVIDKNFFRAKMDAAQNGLLQVMNHQIAIYAAVSILMAGLICFFANEIIGFFYDGKFIEFKTTLYVWGVIAIFFSVTQPLESAIITKKLLNKYNYIRLWMGCAICLVLLLVVPAGGAFGASCVGMGAATISFILGYTMVVNTQKHSKRKSA